MVVNEVVKKTREFEMKLRPQFNLRFRDEDQFLEMKIRADKLGISVNELMLQGAENDAKKSRDGVRVALKPSARVEVVNQFVSPREAVNWNPVCKACEQTLVEMSGKLTCNDVSCGLYGQEQKPRKGEKNGRL